MSAKDRAIKQQLREAQAIQAMHFGALEERQRIIKILKLELAGNDQMLEELIFLINDRNVL